MIWAGFLDSALSLAIPGFWFSRPQENPLKLLASWSSAWTKSPCFFARLLLVPWLPNLMKAQSYPSYGAGYIEGPSKSRFNGKGWGVHRAGCDKPLFCGWEVSSDPIIHQAQFTKNLDTSGEKTRGTILALIKKTLKSCLASKCCYIEK